VCAAGRDGVGRGLVDAGSVADPPGRPTFSSGPSRSQAYKARRGSGGGCSPVRIKPSGSEGGGKAGTMAVG